MDRDSFFGNVLLCAFSKTPQEDENSSSLYSRLVEHLLEKSSVCFCLLHPDFTFFHVNPVFNEWYGDPDKRKCHEIFNQTEDPCPGCPATRPHGDGKTFSRTFLDRNHPKRRLNCLCLGDKKANVLAVLGFEVSNDRAPSPVKPALKQDKEDNREVQDLAKKVLHLEQANKTLRAMLEKGEKQKSELEKQVQFNIRYLIMPYMEKLKKEAPDGFSNIQLDVLFENLEHISSPFVLHLHTAFGKLTPSEIQIADLIRRGKSTREIAAIRMQSRRTVEFHRDNIRKKLGLKKQKMNLRAFLLSLD